jgi:hypothetical protein
MQSASLWTICSWAGVTRHSLPGATSSPSRNGLTARTLSQNGPMSTTRSLTTGRLPIGATVIVCPASTNCFIGVLQLRTAPPSTRIPQEPQTAIRQDRRNASVPSCRSLITSRTSSSEAVVGTSTV